MLSRTIGYAAAAAMLATLAACGGGSSSLDGTTPVTAQSVSVPLSISDASSEDWSMIGVEILSVAFVPQDGGPNVTVYTAPNPAPVTNLVQLDNLSEVIGQPLVNAGTYKGAIVTVSANPGDVQLVTASDPEPGFPVAAGTAIPATAIQIQGARGGTGSLTVPINVRFESPITVASAQVSPVDVEFDLAHPAFIAAHAPPAGGGATVWAVNFNGPVRHHPVRDLTRLVLRHAYGNVGSVAADNGSITIARDVPTRPVVNPETATATGQSLTVLADASNGTLFYDVDARTSATLRDFSSVAAVLPGKYVRVAARYQQNGTLVATRIWASTAFSSIWLSPEGHVAHVDAANARFVVDDESGKPVLIAVGSGTEFYFRQPQSALADATPIGTGPGFLTAGNLVRGFKVHVSVVDPLATPLVAQTVDIETARYDGRISAVTGSGFKYTRSFRTAFDDYSQTLDYIASGTPNGKDSAGNPIMGFKYWDFAYPTLVTSGSAAVSSFMSATSGAVNFGGTIGAVVPWGVSFASWGDPADASGWSAPWVVLAPVPLPLGFVTTGLQSDNTFTMSVPNGTLSPVIDVSTANGSATLVYQVDRTNGVVTVSAEDVTTSAGLAALTAGLATNAPVKVYGVPQADGSLRAYVLSYYTGTAPTL
jgi:hypothetical protein